MTTQVKLPKRQIYKTPRLLVDAYTLGADKFQSEKAKEKSVYYLVYRKKLHTINPDLYNVGDDRIIAIGHSRIIEKLFYDPITHDEIDETKRFLEYAKATGKGNTKYWFPEEMWRDVVDNYNGRPPIQIMAVPEGSVVYPNEPVMQIKSLVKGYGELAAWFESKILKMWAPSERVTQDQHFFQYMLGMVKRVNSDLDDETAYFLASLMVSDFGDRAGMNDTESEELGMYHLLTWAGTDTFSGAYQAWKNSRETLGGFSVNALAHRNVQAYLNEVDCYTTMYERADNYEFLSNVADCYDFDYTVENYLLPLAKRSIVENNGKVVVARPDSGDALRQVLFICRLAVQHGLYTEQVINGKTWKFSTSLKFIEGDGMDFKTMKIITEALMDEGFVPYSWGLFGVGGGLRNGLKRDNLSAKFALCSMGEDDTAVVKFSEILGKVTLPGPFKLLRDPESLANKITIVFENEAGENYHILFFDGLRIMEPFGPGQDDDFLDWKERIKTQMRTMPLNLETPENLNYPASEAIVVERNRLLAKYAPNKKPLGEFAQVA